MWISMWDTNTLLSVSFLFSLSTDATADAASCSTFASFILTLEKSEPKIWMHIRHYLNSAKATAIQETQNMYSVDAAASHAENLCKWCLSSLVDIAWECLFQNILNDSARRLQYGHSTIEKFFIRAIQICCKSGLLITSCRYWLLNWQP